MALFLGASSTFVLFTVWLIDVMMQDILKTRLLKRLFEYGTTLGQQPALLCLDSNTTVHASLVLSQALTSKNRVDLGSYFTKDNPECTFSSAAQWDKISTGAGVARPDWQGLT